MWRNEILGVQALSIKPHYNTLKTTLIIGHPSGCSQKLTPGGADLARTGIRRWKEVTIFAVGWGSSPQKLQKLSTSELSEVRVVGAQLTPITWGYESLLSATISESLQMDQMDWLEAKRQWKTAHNQNHILPSSTHFEGFGCLPLKLGGCIAQTLLSVTVAVLDIDDVVDLLPGEFGRMDFYEQHKHECIFCPTNQRFHWIQRINATCHGFDYGKSCYCFTTTIFSRWNGLWIKRSVAKFGENRDDRDAWVMMMCGCVEGSQSSHQRKKLVATIEFPHWSLYLLYVMSCVCKVKQRAGDWT